jgi:hypothetical protein
MIFLQKYFDFSVFYIRFVTLFKRKLHYFGEQSGVKIKKIKKSFKKIWRLKKSLYLCSPKSVNELI